MTTVIYHRADYDGLFSAAVCAEFLPKDTGFIGWDYGDSLIPQPEGTTYIVDLSPSCLESVYVDRRLIWIDHHKSSITEWDDLLGNPFAGYRIDGVAACRLCWAWFMAEEYDPVHGALPAKDDFVNRRVTEPLAVRLAGEYDVWDHRDSRAVPFQYGLSLEGARSFQSLSHLMPLKPYRLKCDDETATAYAEKSAESGRVAMLWQQQFAHGICKSRSYLREWEGVRFCVLGSAHAVNSQWMPEDALPDGTQALMKWHYDGAKVSFSLYHAPGHEEHDLSAIAVKYGGGGHRGACGFAMSLDDALEVIR